MAVCLAVVSFAIYAAILGPIEALVFIAGLRAHAFGHVFAAGCYGIKARVWFVPLLGIVEVLDDEPPTLFAQAFVALAGPMVGLLFVQVAYGGFWLAGWDASLSCGLLAAFNIANLLPIPPLDGGRVARALLRSLPNRFLSPRP